VPQYNKGTSLDEQADGNEFPRAIIEEFDKSKNVLNSILTANQLKAWADHGFYIARHDSRSWEAATEFFKTSTKIVAICPGSNLINWAKVGSSICEQSPTLAIAYFKASFATIPNIETHRINDWAQMGRTLYNGTWKSSTLSAKFFEESPRIFAVLNFDQAQRLVDLLNIISRKSYTMATECLILSGSVFKKVGSSKDTFLGLAEDVANSTWREVKGLFEASAGSLSKLDSAQIPRFLNLTANLAKNKEQKVSSFIRDSMSAISQVDVSNHALIMTLSEVLLSESASNVGDFIKNTPIVLGKLTTNQFEEWFNEGLKVLKENDAAGSAYFKIESSWVEHIIDNLSSTLEFDKVKEISAMYCQALAGADIKVAPIENLVSKNIGWVSGEKATTEGKTIFLPPSINKYDNKYQNFAWFKVIATHQVAHLEFGSFDFIFDEPSTLFEDLRFKLLIQKEKSESESENNADRSTSRDWMTDMQRLFNLFEDRKLILDIFTIVEDGRLDARVKHEYRGISKDYKLVQEESLNDRPDIKSKPAREALVEFLVRYSLKPDQKILVPKEFLEKANSLLTIFKRVFIPISTVQDSAEATIRLYAILFDITNTKKEDEDWENLDTEEQEDEEYQEPPGMEDLIENMSHPNEQELQDSEEEYQPTQDVDFRGEFKPELVQLLSALQEDQEDESVETPEFSKEMLEDLLKQTAELEMQSEEGDPEKTVSIFADNLVKEAQLNKPQTPEDGAGNSLDEGEGDGALEATEPLSYLYDEWDFRAEDYKPRWCVVRQKVMPEGDLTFYSETMRNYSSMVSQIKRQFEMVIPEMFRRVYRLPDGDEYDLDAVIEAKVDARTGNSPSDKLYWKRNKVIRDVAVIFLLDLSASTAEAIEESKHLPDQWDAPDDPAEYMTWLRNRRNQNSRRTHKRIVDIEKESAVLLISALETIGDTYGIYGFSGYGRENVEFYVIKDLDEKFSDKVKRRIDRVAPLHATRMGPAIRHAVFKLNEQSAKTKILFLISDGRPQDRGYSREGVEKEYAVHDTRMALIEAKRKQIIPFCLTVDKSGHDYLKTMCQDMGYEVLADIQALPKRLPFLYRKLTD